MGRRTGGLDSECLWKRGTYAYLIGVKVDPSILASSFRDERNALVQLAKRVVAAAAVCEDLDAIEPPGAWSAM